jgi:Tol biopolymer transport system component
MGEPSIGTPPLERGLEDRLESWKEIAAYLKRDVTTVQRWEKREGMPVHRHLHDKMGSVYASRAELDTWTRSRSLRGAQASGVEAQAANPPSSPLYPETTAFRTGWKPVLLLAVAGLVLATGTWMWLQRTEYFWRTPIANARFQPLTDFGGVEQAATVSRDGHLAAFLSDRDGQVDVWVTQIGSGQFHNLTHGSMAEVVNPSVRTLGFSPDGSLVTFWARKLEGSSGENISVWGVPTLGGQPSPYLEGVAEFDWSRDGSRLVYHTPGPGDPLFVSSGGLQPGAQAIFTAPPGLHSHFPLWSPDTTLSISCREPCRTSWTSGESVQPEGCRKESRRTMRG